MNPSELASDISTISIIVMAVFALVIVGGSALFAFFFMSGKEHSSGKKIGIGIAVVAIGMFFLMCLGLPMLFFGFSYNSYEASEASSIPNVRSDQKSDRISELTPNDTPPILPNQKKTTPSPKPKKKFGDIPVEVKPKTNKQPFKDNS